MQLQYLYYEMQSWPGRHVQPAVFHPELDWSLSAAVEGLRVAARSPDVHFSFGVCSFLKAFEKNCLSFASLLGRITTVILEVIIAGMLFLTLATGTVVSCVAAAKNVCRNQIKMTIWRHRWVLFSVSFRTRLPHLTGWFSSLTVDSWQAVRSGNKERLSWNMTCVLCSHQRAVENNWIVFERNINIHLLWVHWGSPAHVRHSPVAAFVLKEQTCVLSRMLFFY